jgi:hypothetical protein
MLGVSSCVGTGSREEQEMIGIIRVAHPVAVVCLGLLLCGCAAGTGSVGTSPPASTTTSFAGTASPSSSLGAQDIAELPNFAPLEPGPYFIDPDDDPSTPLRVLYTIPSDGWSQWIGAFKEGEAPAGGLVGISITTVTNLVADGCRDLDPADPPVGPSIDDLATALTEFPPFKVAEPPSAVTVYGYEGTHLALIVPDSPPQADDGRWPDCQGGELTSWISPGLSYAFHGYTGPGQVEEFWILDVDGSRLVIAAMRTPDAPRKLVAEMRDVLDSIQIEP